MLLFDLLPLLIIFLGVLFLIKPDTYLKLIRLSNELRGAKTKITDKTILMGKIVGVGFILFGLFILGTFSIPSMFLFNM